MHDPEPHQEPPAPVDLGIDRRQLLVLGTGLALVPELSAAARASAPTAGASRAFMQVSRAVIDAYPLDAPLGAAYEAGLRAADPQFAAALSQLATLSARAATPEALLEAARGAGLAPALQAIVAAWYTGSVGDALAPRIAFAGALMHRPVADAVPVPTFCIGGPQWWTAEPPPLTPPSPQRGRA